MARLSKMVDITRRTPGGEIIVLGSQREEALALARGAPAAPAAQDAAKAEGRERVRASAPIQRMASRFARVLGLGTDYVRRDAELAARPFKRHEDTIRSMQEAEDGFIAALMPELEGFNNDEGEVRAAYIRGAPVFSPASNLDALRALLEVIVAPSLAPEQVFARAEAAVVAGDLPLAYQFRALLGAWSAKPGGAYRGDGMYGRTEAVLDRLDAALVSPDLRASEYATVLLEKARADWMYLVSTLVSTRGKWDPAQDAAGVLTFPALVRGA